VSCSVLQCVASNTILRKSCKNKTKSILYVGRKSLFCIHMSLFWSLFTCIGLFLGVAMCRSMLQCVAAHFKTLVWVSFAHIYVFCVSFAHIYVFCVSFAHIYVFFFALDSHIYMRNTYITTHIYNTYICAIYNIYVFCGRLI